jgi:hypothetical protein
MTETVKTTLLKAVATMLQGLPGVATIKRDWQFPLDLAANDGEGNPILPLPALLFYEDHDAPGIDNRLAKNELDLDLVLFDAFTGPVTDEDSPAWQTFKDSADLVAAYIHGLWHNRTALAPLRSTGLMKVEERGNRKAFCTEEYGEMVLTVRLTYGHPLGQALTN